MTCAKHTHLASNHSTDSSLALSSEQFLPKAVVSALEASVHWGPSKSDLQNVVMLSTIGHYSEFSSTNCSAANTRVEVYNINYLSLARSTKFRDKNKF